MFFEIVLLLVCIEGDNSETELDKNTEKKIESERKQRLKEQIRKRDFLV
jgi:hypothetical protein